MLNIIKYIMYGLLHYCNLLFSMFDFQELWFMWLIIVVLLISIIINKDVRVSVFSLIKHFLKTLKTFPGIFFFLILSAYYSYVAMFFEERITIVVLFLSIYLFLQTFIEVSLSILVESEKTLWRTLKKFSLPVIILCIQQITVMLENNNFSNLRVVLYSLLIIPIFSIFYSLLKHVCIYLDFYSKHKRYVKIGEYELFLVFVEGLSLSNNYKINDILLNEFIVKNYSLNSEEMKKKVNEDFPEKISNMKKIKKEINITKNIKKTPSELFRKLHKFWLLNILLILFSILMKRFCGSAFGILYYVCFFVIIIYFLYDLLRVRNIENQYDFIMYLIIYITTIVLLVFYSRNLKVIRLTELAFMMPIFLFVRYKSYFSPEINFLNLPLLSDNNFFGLDPKNYKITHKN